MIAHFSLGWATITALVLVLFTIIAPVATVDRGRFKTCEQSGFCTRNRNLAAQASAYGSGWSSPYALDATSISFKDGILSGTILKTIDKNSGETKRLPLTISFLESGAARVVVDEEARKNGDITLRHDAPIKKQRYNGLEDWVIAGGLKKSRGAALVKDAEMGTTRVTFGKDGKHEAVIQHGPFKLEFKRDGETQIVMNEGGLMNMEHWRPKVEKKKENEDNGENKSEEDKEQNLPQDDDEMTWWEEGFGGATDSKPRGPESVAMDFTFPGYEHVYGVPEHAGPMNLKETKGGGDGKYDQPYRLYNSDIFEHELDSPMTLYGTIPFMQAQKKGSTVGVFWLNAAELWVDVYKSKESTNPLSLGTSGATSTHSHWFFESGLIDVFVMLGPTPRDVSTTYGELTGYTQLPQQFAIAYHQCRWNYVTDQDVRDVDRKFDRHDIPYDVIWLDIDYLDDKQYFVWNPLTFSDPLGMQKQLDEHSRKLVAIIDPHIKRKEGYYVHDEIKSKDLAVKGSRADEPWEGHCWPGASYWIDCFNPAAIEWWKSLFQYDRFKGSMHNTFIWNDMNEPSVMNGPEHTMPRDNVHHGGWEHRDIHNLNGLTFHNATYQALATREDLKNHKTPTIRPFILTRSFYAGSQRLGAMWTGDNQAKWSHLAAALPMILNNGISGYPFSGADVGGFMGNPSPELLARWYQAGSFYPFFRAHAHIDTKRREPYLIQEPHKRYIAQAIRLRYSLLPAWYTAFHTASIEGIPIVRPMWWQHPSDEQGFALDDQMYLGDTGLLVKPVTEERKESVDIHLPAEATPAPYYDYFTFTKYRASAKGGKVSVPAPMDTLPLLMRAGHIFPRRDRPRRSSGLMANDPFTLVINLDPAKFSDDSATRIAEGSLYHDDGESYSYEKGARIHRQFTFTAGGLLRSEDAESDATVANGKAKKEYLSKTDHLFVEKVVLVGVPDSWTDGSKNSVKVREDSGKGKVEEKVDVQKGTDKTANWAVVKLPRVKIGRDWEIAFS